MFSDTFLKYLLEYQKEDFKPEEEKEFKFEKKPLSVIKGNYAVVPVNAK